MGFKIENGVLKKYIKKKSEEDVVIPDGVKKIEESAFVFCENLKSITIPDSVKKIDDSAFSGCTNLVSINIPYGIKKINDSIFEDCSSLTSIIIPDSVTEIGEFAFSGCCSLENITIPNGVKEIGECSFSYSGLKSINIPAGITKINESTFNSCSDLTNITIPNSVTEICKYAFSWCNSLENITIPDSVTEIGEKAFYHCFGLKKITIPDSVTKIGGNSFSLCKNLTTIHIPESVVDFGIDFLSECDNLTEITRNRFLKVDNGFVYRTDSNKILSILERKKEYIISGEMACSETYLFNLAVVILKKDDISVRINVNRNSGELSRFLSAETKEKKEEEFSNLKESCLKIPAAIYYAAIYNSTKLKSYLKRYAKKVVQYFEEVIKKDNEHKNDYLSEIKILLSLGVINKKNIGELISYTHVNCKEICELLVQYKQEVIGDDANVSEESGMYYNVKNEELIEFKLLDDRTELRIPENVKRFRCRFENCDKIERLILPKSYDEDFRFLLHYIENYMKQLKEIIFEDGNEKYLSLNGIIMQRKGEKVNIVYIPESYFKKFVVPKEVNGEIFPASDINYYKNSITSVILPETIEYILSEEFSDCSNLIEITIPESVKSIGYQAFKNCISIPKIVLPKNLKHIRGGAFEYCTQLKSINLPETIDKIEYKTFSHCYCLTEITIGEGVTEIGEYAFEYCTGLTCITFPDSVMKISEFAFCGCENLKEIILPDTIDITSFDGCNATVIKRKKKSI